MDLVRLAKDGLADVSRRLHRYRRFQPMLPAGRVEIPFQDPHVFLRWTGRFRRADHRGRNEVPEVQNMHLGRPELSAEIARPLESARRRLIEVEGNQAQALVFSVAIGMRLATAAAVLGMAMVSSPFFSSAWMWAVSACSGSVKLRVKLP
jgi:hypothetical protein